MDISLCWRRPCSQHYFSSDTEVSGTRINYRDDNINKNNYQKEDNENRLIEKRVENASEIEGDLEDMHC